MTDPAVTYTFTPGTNILSSQANQNFTDLINFLKLTGVAAYQAGSIQTAALAGLSVTGPKIALNAVANGNLAANAAVLAPGTIAAIPAASSVPAGTLYPATDVGAGAVYRSDGSAWAVIASMTGTTPGANTVTTSALAPTLSAQLGLGSAANSDVRRGKAIITTAETTTSAAFGLLTTPDQVQNIVLPTDGIIRVRYHAHWKASLAGSVIAAAIFVGSNQLKVPVANGVPAVSQGSLTGGAATYAHLFAGTAALSSATLHTETSAGNVTTDVSDVTTGQVIGTTATMGMQSPYVDIEAAAGTYTISVQYKTSSGTLTVKNRRLWVEAIGF